MNYNDQVLIILEFSENDVKSKIGYLNYDFET